MFGQQFSGRTGDTFAVFDIDFCGEAAGGKLLVGDLALTTAAGRADFESEYREIMKRSNHR